MMAGKKLKPEPAPVGRPTKYKPEYCKAIIDYFDIPAIDSDGKANDPLFIINFCLSIGISKDCLHKWVAKYPEFNDAYSVAKEKQKQLIIINAAQDRYNASFTWKMMMNMFGWRDKQDVDNKITLPPGLKISFEE